MSKLWDSFRNLFTPIRTLPTGIHHYQSPPDDPRNYRLHLRLEKDGSGVLIVNAATILHLNQTAAEYAYYLIQNEPVDKVASKMVNRYHVDPEQARKDYLDFTDRMQILINTPDLDPVTFLDFERQQPFSGSLSSPYRLDCALTYRLPTDEPTDAAPVDRVTRELNAAEWNVIIDKAWKAGIPHIVFTGGEATLREDLPDLIAHAESNGQVSGLLTDGLRLSDREYLHILLRTGLDHLLIVLQPENDDSWKAVENAMVEDLSVAVHLTLTRRNYQSATSLLERLSSLGVKQISLSIEDTSLSDALKTAREKAASLHLELVWNLPVPYSSLHPVAMEVGDAAIEGAGRAWLYVEPDGDVLASQGSHQVLGNMLKDPWEKLWKGSAQENPD